MLITIFINSFLLTSFSNASENNTFFVDDNFDSSVSGWNVSHFSKIFDAINKSGQGDTVFVYNGTYAENIIINKSIYLIGENQNNTLIDGQHIGNVVSIFADNTSINNFTIINSGTALNNSGVMVLSDENSIYKNTILNSSIGVVLHYCKDNIIQQNTVKHNVFGIGIHNCNEENRIAENEVFDNNASGIYLAYCKNNTIFDNFVKGNSYGIAISFGSYNNVSENIILQNKDGINLYFCNQTTIFKNSIFDSEYGLTSTESNFNKIYENYVANSTIRGINLVIGSDNNKLYKNTISGCDMGVYISIDSFETILFENMFSDNTQKLVDESILVSYSSPGFELIFIVIGSIVIILTQKKYI